MSEDDMDGDYWFDFPLSDGTQLVISTVSNQAAHETECHFLDGFGYHLCIWEKSEQRILARFVDSESAMLAAALLNPLKRIQHLEAKLTKAREALQKTLAMCMAIPEASNAWHEARQEISKLSFTALKALEEGSEG